MIQNIEVIDVAFMLNNTLFAEKVSTLHDLSFSKQDEHVLQDFI